MAVVVVMTPLRISYSSPAVAPPEDPRSPLPDADDADAGTREHFADAALYDFEYRRRRADVTFYRRLVADRMACPRPGPVLDLACGTGRLLVPLLRDGHAVLGLDRSAAMLARARRRLLRLAPARRAHAQLVRGDLRRLAFAPRFAIALCAFHSVQHLLDEGALGDFFRGAAASLAPGGWLAFDLLPPDPRWLEQDGNRRWARTIFHHPSTGERLVYTTNHRYDPARRLLHMRLYYQPVDGRGDPNGPERLIRLCHRQLAPDEVRALLAGAGFHLMAAFAGWDGRPLPDGDGLPADEHVYVARLR
jgi:SAM-dependent methyltransferase